MSLLIPQLVLNVGIFLYNIYYDINKESNEVHDDRYYEFIPIDIITYNSICNSFIKKYNIVN